MQARWAVMVGLVLAASCGGTKEGPKGRVDPLTTTVGICERWAAGACNEDVVRDCNGSSGTVEQCVDDQAAFCADKLVGEGFDRDLALTCIETVTAAYEDREITAEERREVILVTAGPCADLAASGVAGGGEGGQGGGGANPPEPKEGGDDCDPSTDVCVATHYCDPAVNICRSKAAAGEICCTNDPQFLLPTCGPDTEEKPCTPGTFCGEEGLCVALGTTDAACAGDAQCALGYFCGSGGTCQPLGEDSDACETDDECAGGYFCSQSFGQCRDFILVGTAELCRDLGA